VVSFQLSVLGVCGGQLSQPGTETLSLVSNQKELSVAAVKITDN
jgi:hypothetical protein